MLTEMTNEQDKFDLITIELIKKSGKGLGMNLSIYLFHQSFVFFQDLVSSDDDMVMAYLFPIL
jgi:hypothetical protein